MRSTFITWYPYCRRSDTLAEALGGTSHLVHYLGFKRPLHAPFKYVAQTWATLRILARERPDTVLVAVPPLMAALPVLLYARLTGARVVIDAHTGIFDHARWTWLLPLTRWTFRRAAAVIVTNEHLRETVAAWQGNPIVIGDVPVAFVQGSAPAACKGARAVVVNTFSVDEPVGEILEAARRTPDTNFFVTGDLAHARREWLDAKPPNVSFTGFVSEDEYAGLMRAADVVVVLTTHDHTMQRGAYEAVALEKPLVTSDWRLLRETFSRGTIHVGNHAEEIAEGVARALDRRSTLAEEMRLLKREREALFRSRLSALCTILGSGSGGGARNAATESS